LWATYNEEPGEQISLFGDGGSEMSKDLSFFFYKTHERGSSFFAAQTKIRKCRPQGGTAKGDILWGGENITLHTPKKTQCGRL